MKMSRQHKVLAFYIIFQLIGIIGWFSPLHDAFVSLTPLNLIISCICILVYQQKWKKSQLLALLTIGLLGYCIEVIGTSTGLIFGGYTYGNNLGPKVFDTPIIMALNWVLPVYAIGIISNFFSSNIYVKSLVGATLMLLFDIILEPTAIYADYWNWSNDNIPVLNYLAWFIISFVFLLIFHFIHFRHKNTIAVVFLIGSSILFIGTNLVFTNDTQYYYAAILILCFASVATISTTSFTNYIQRWKPLLKASLLPAILFTLWDIWFVSQGVWEFNPKYNAGIIIMGLPLEEYLFFFIIPFCCVFIYENIVRIQVPNWLGYSAGFLILMLLVFITTQTSLGLYTNVSTMVFLLMVILTVVFTQYAVVPISITAFLSFIPFLLVNGILTGSFGNEPIVMYNNAENCGLRFLNIPLEDFIYGTSLITGTIISYELQTKFIKNHNQIIQLWKK